MLSEYQGRDVAFYNPEGPVPDKTPIEPQGPGLRGFNWLKWIILVLVLSYIALSYYSGPLLVRLGQYLVLAHSPEKSDIIVCLAGNNVERGLAAADAYRKGLAPKILLTREELPDGYNLLRDKGVEYPETIDLLEKILVGLGVPRSDLIITDEPVKSTLDEATLVKGVVEREGFRSLLIITSPTHSRRSWITFRKVIQKDNVRILMMPSPYSDFRAEDWWKKRKYLREVIVEYEKLIYYYFKNFH